MQKMEALEREGGFGGPLYRKLVDYGKSDYYGFHMPGHKRQLGVFENPFCFDITEIDGFDDLHHPEADGILTKAQERAALLYGAEETHFLVGGSTAGILSAISACVKRNGRMLLSRNSHRSAYHGAELGNLIVTYLYPQTVDSLGINGSVLPEDVEKALRENASGVDRWEAAGTNADGAGVPARSRARIQAVMITSPTYDGVCSDVRAIAEICHRYGVPLIVDQAHGAHFPFSDYFPEDAVSAGADVVIHSVHKTLPALTQTALLHVQGALVDRERLRHYLSVYQSSSPSYVLMASIDACVDLLERKGTELFAEHVKRLSAFRESCRDLRGLFLAGEDMGDFDRSKLLIFCGDTGLTGGRLSELLLERYHLQMEMAGLNYVVGIASVADTEEGFARLEKALHKIDREYGKKGSAAEKAAAGMRTAASSAAGFSRPLGVRIPRLLPGLTAAEAAERPRVLCALGAAAGRLAADYVYLYPPGLPLIVPGEVVTAEAAARIREWLAAGFTVHGIVPGQNEKEPLLPVLAEAAIGF